jgi:hypothetical protein
MKVVWGKPGAFARAAVVEAETETVLATANVAHATRWRGQ